MTEAPRIKGFALRGLLKHVKKSDYPGGIGALLARVPPPGSEAFAERILSGDWYPYAAFSALIQTIVREMADDEPPEAVLHEIGRAAAAEDLRGVFRFVSIMLSVERVVRASAAFWPRYCDSGSLEVVEAGAGRFTVRLSGFPTIDPAHCHLIRGWIHGLGEGSGAGAIEVRKTKCVHRGDGCCEYSGTWS